MQFLFTPSNYHNDYRYNGISIHFTTRIEDSKKSVTRALKKISLDS
jgi:hypothetical protein